MIYIITSTCKVHGLFSIKWSTQKNISLLRKIQLLGMCGETKAPPTSRNSSPRFLWLEPTLSSRSCWWAPIFRCLSPTLLYRPWCLLPGWSTRYPVNEGKGRGGTKQTGVYYNKCTADEKRCATTRNIPAGKCQERDSHRCQLAGLAGCWILPGLLQRLGGHHPVSDAATPNSPYFLSSPQSASWQPISITDSPPDENKNCIHISSFVANRLALHLLIRVVVTKRSR